MSIFTEMIPGYFKDRLKEQAGVPTMEHCLRNLHMLGYRPNIAVDIGAYEGEWTHLCKKVFPSCAVLMVEAQEKKRAYLEQLSEQLSDTKVKIALLGAEQGANVAFYMQETASSVLPESAKAKQAPHQLLPMDTLNAVTRRMGISKCDLMKLDVQGYELEILKGGNRIMNGCEVIIMEVSLLAIHEGVPLLLEVVNFMDSHGYRAYDLCGLCRRPLDKALWQIDLVFVEKSSKLMESCAWI